MDLLQTIYGWGQRSADKVAYTSCNQSITYGELSSKAKLLAAIIKNRYGSAGQALIVYGHKEPEMLIAFLACAGIGRTYVPVDSVVPQERLRDIEAIAGAPVILTPDVIQSLLLGPHDFSIDDVTFPAQDIPGNHPWYIMFTSGSTGQPKGVQVSRYNVQFFIDWMFAEHSFTSGSEVFLNQAPFSFDISILDIFSALYSGGTAVGLTRNELGNPRMLFQCLQSQPITVWGSTPSFARLCLREPSFNEHMMPNLRRFILAGEQLSSELASALIARFPKAGLWNGYGPTEATVYSSTIKITPELIGRYPHLPIGHPMPGSELVILDPQRNAVADGERGQITIVGPNVSLGYLNRADLTSKVFFSYQGRPAYSSGDIGYRQDGLFFCEGRQDGQLKLHGFRIELGDIESNLRKISGVVDCLVIPKLNSGQPEFLGAFVVPTVDVKKFSNAESFEYIRELKQKLGELIPHYMVPQRFVFIDSIPMNVNGKADHKLLLQLLS